MGETWNLQNCFLNTQLNKISNQQQNRINVVSYAQIALNKRIFWLDQPVCMQSKQESQVYLGTGASNGSFSDAMTLPINDWLFYL